MQRTQIINSNLRRQVNYTFSHLSDGDETSGSPMNINFRKKSRTRILVVEDNEINQKVFKLMLSDKEFEVDIASNGQAGIDMCTCNTYDFILMDYGLPDMCGPEVTKRIRQFEESKGRHTIIIGATANGEYARDECLNAGMDEFMTKPIMLDALKKILKKYKPSDS